MNTYIPNICVSIPNDIVDPIQRVRFYKKEYAKQYYHLNIHKVTITKKKTYINNVETNRKYALEYQKSHPEVRKRNRPKYRQKEIEYAKNWNKNNRERIRKRRLEIYKKDSSKVESCNHSYRAKKRKVFSDSKGCIQFIKLIRSKDLVRCYYCDSEISGKKAHIDHVVALSKNGNHASENLAASCSKCNLSKHNKLISEWNKPGQQILSL